MNDPTRPVKKFPCPYCKGQGSLVEPVLDWGQGPRYECVICDGEGMIMIDGPRHQIIKTFKSPRR